MVKSAISRRWFIGGACSAVMGARFGAIAGNLGAGRPIMRFGALSDVHIRKPGDEAPFIKALTYFRDNGVDAVLIAGDIADLGQISQLEITAKAWFSVFPNDKAPDGRHVERLFVYGNHDIVGWTYANQQYKDDADKRRRAIGFENNRATTWERLFHEEYTPVWMKTVKGIRFVGAHWEKHCPKIEPFMAEHGKEFDPSLPFFYTQHSHPKDTCYGAWAWGHDPGYATRALSPFPNAVALSGHSHYTLVDERSVWQGAFTSIGTATLKYTSLDYLEPENAGGNSYDPDAKAWTHKRIMGRAPRMSDGKEGMVFDVYADRLVIQRRNFALDRPLGDDWTVPIPSSADTPFAYAKRAKKRSAPKFAPGSAVKVEFPDRKPACANKEAKGPFVLVSFPAAKTVDKCRTFEYEVRAVDQEGGKVLSRRVMAPGFNLPEQDCALQGECLFEVAEFAKGTTVRFEVRASECFGTKGDPIVSEPVKIGA